MNPTVEHHISLSICSVTDFWFTKNSKYATFHNFANDLHKVLIQYDNNSFVLEKTEHVRLWNYLRDKLSQIFGFNIITIDNAIYDFFVNREWLEYHKTVVMMKNYFPSAFNKLG